MVGAGSGRNQPLTWGTLMNEQTVTIDLLDVDRTAVSAEVSIRRDTVEIRCREQLVAVQGRDQLRDWLARPDGLLNCDETTWLWNGWSVSLCIAGMVPVRALGFDVVEDLRRHM
jgi:hypothetical protein